MEISVCDLYVDPFAHCQYLVYEIFKNLSWLYAALNPVHRLPRYYSLTKTKYAIL